MKTSIEAAASAAVVSGRTATLPAAARAAGERHARRAKTRRVERARPSRLRDLLAAAVAALEALSGDARLPADLAALARAGSRAADALARELRGEP